MAERSGRGKWLWIVTAGVVLIVVIYTALSLLRPTVDVVAAGRGPVIQAFYATGTVEPQRTFPVRSNLAGIVTRVLVDKGDRVTVGTPLAEVTDPRLEYELRRSQAELAEKQARVRPTLTAYDARLEAIAKRLSIAQREQDRVLQMAETSTASVQDVDFAADRLATSAADLAALQSERESARLLMEREIATAQAGVDTSQWNMQQQLIVAPVDGAVLDRPVPVGTRVAINDDLMQMADVRAEALVMRAAVDEEDVAGATVGQAVEMSLYSFPGQTLTGRVTKIYDEADQQRRTFEVDVRFEQPPAALAAGMTGELAFVLDRKDAAVTVPAQAVQHDAVWTVEGGTLARRDVKLGLISVERAEIINGLNEGDQVVISPVASDDQGKHVRTNLIKTDTPD